METTIKRTQTAFRLSYKTNSQQTRSRYAVQNHIGTYVGFLGVAL